MKTHILTTAVCVLCAVLLSGCRAQKLDGMVHVRGGDYTMGDGKFHARYDVKIDDYSIGIHEVTNKVFARVYNWALDQGYLYIATGEQTSRTDFRPWNIGEMYPDFCFLQLEYIVRIRKDFPWPLIECHEKRCHIQYRDGRFVVDAGAEKLPVVEVSWFGAAAYCNFLSKMEGFTPVYEEEYWDSNPDVQGYRLPASAEWEYAAAGGRTSEGSTGGCSSSPDDRAWFGDNSGGHVHPVALKQPNNLGIYDMCGNVWEFCNEKFGIYKGIISNDPLGKELYTSYRLWRGGGYRSDTVSIYPFQQCIDLPSLLQGADDLGFRIVLQGGK